MKAVKGKGRVITSQGQKLLDNTAYAVSIKPKTKKEAIKVVKEKAKELVEQVSEKQASGKKESGDPKAGAPKSEEKKEDTKEKKPKPDKKS